MDCCNDEFSAYIKDKQPSSANDLKKFANAFKEARPNISFVKIDRDPISFDGSTSSRRQECCLRDRSADGRHISPYRGPTSRTQRRPQSRPNHKSTIVCFYCNKPGHTKSECYQRARMKIQPNEVQNRDVTIGPL